MRRAVVTAVVSGGLLLTAAAPAAAAPFEESGTSAFLFSETTGQCTTSGRCTDLFLEAFTGTTEPGHVCLQTVSYRPTARGGRADVTDEHGCGEAGSALSVAPGAATLLPTTLTLEAFSCTGGSDEKEPDCTATGSREVTVSAAYSADGPVTTSRDRGRSRTGRCQFTYRSTTTSAPVAGSLTVDGTAHAGTGQAGTTAYRVTSKRCGTP